MKEASSAEFRAMPRPTSAEEAYEIQSSIPEFLESKEAYEFFLDHSRDIILVLDNRGKIIYVNKRVLTDFGYPKEEIIGMSIINFLTKDSIKEAFHALAQEFLGRLRPDLELRTITKSGEIKSIRVAESSAHLYKNGRIIGIMVSASDITEQKKAELELRQSEIRFRDLWDNAPVAYHTADTNGVITSANQTEARMLGYRKDELIGRPIFDFILPEQREEARDRFQKKIAGKYLPRSVNRIFVRKDGSEVHVVVDDTLEQDGSGHPTGLRSTLVDITKLRESEDARKTAEEHFRYLVEKSDIAILIDDRDGHLQYFNDRFAEMFGYSAAEMKKQTIWSIVHPDDAEKLRAYHIGRLEGQNRPSRYELKAVRKDGSVIYLEADVSVLKDGEHPIGTRNYIWDITERKKAQDKHRETEDRFRSIVEHSHDGIQILNDDFQIIYANAEASRISGYTNAEFIGQDFRNFIDAESRKLVSEAYVRRQKGEKVPARYEFKIVRKDGEKRLMEVISSVVTGARGRLETIAQLRDITERKQAELELRKSVEDLRKITGATVQAIASAVESRDPYTAGHQKKVADLARRIATEMGLPRDKIEGLRTAGAIHDLGKLSIPAEILSKPTKLSDCEFALIKLHSERGYEILKDISFPWPVARIVLEHHERLNGSGYPRGLKGEEILLESRILAVADVVEAIASHRPYRPAKGVDAALQEIAANRGTLYDPGVVDACLRVFEKGYQFADPDGKRVELP